MKKLNIEIKARCLDLTKIQEILQLHNATFLGIDYQIDTYFKTHNGRLKLRETILPFERGLIYYKRRDKHQPKMSDLTVFQTPEENLLKQILTESLETLIIVQKKRILFIVDNVKFHLDSVVGLGDFLEIEAQDTHSLIGKSTLNKQCKYYMKLLNIKPADLISYSYSDLLLKEK